jgi:hypothetical protein
MGTKQAQRQINHIANGSLILKDTYQTPTGPIEKQKLVQLYPDKHMWTSTHLSGPNKYSQFLYQITSLSKDTSTLTFTAAHIEYDEVTDPAVLSEELCQADAQIWKLLATAMENELKK